MATSEKTAYPSVAIQRVYSTVSKLFEQGGRGSDSPREAVLLMQKMRDRLWRGVMLGIDSWNGRFSLNWTDVKYGPQYEEMMRLQHDKTLIVDVIQQCEEQLENINGAIADKAAEIERGKLS